MICGFGLVNKDFVAVVPRWERDEKIESSAYFEQVGGPVPVALTAIARLGVAEPVEHFGVVGDDHDGEHLRELLELQGVGGAGICCASGIATSRSLVFLDNRDGSRTLANYAETLPPTLWTDTDRERLATARLLHLDGRDLPAALEAARIVRAAGGIVSYDLGTMRPGREELIRLCDIVLASRKGGAGAFPDAAQDPEEQVRRFLAMGVRVAGVTLAEQGVVIGEQGKEPVRLPACTVEKVVDTCGAGDTFHGAFLWAFLQGRDPVSCANFAQAAVALRIQRYGNQAGLPTRTEVETFMGSVSAQ
jgi:sulfofructose kinase